MSLLQIFKTAGVFFLGAGLFLSGSILYAADTSAWWEAFESAKKEIAALRADAVKPENPVYTALTVLPPVAFPARLIGGKYWDCEPLLSPEENPHHFELRPRHLQALSRAALFIHSGMPFEESLRVRVEKRFPDLPQLSLNPSAPHAWLSPEELCAMAEEICRKFCEKDPVHAAYYRERYQRFFRAADALRRVKEEVQPHLHPRAFGAYHDAYGCFARSLKCEQIALEQDGKEPGVRHLAAVKEVFLQKKIRVLFVQNEAEKKRAKRIREACPELAVHTENLLAENALQTICNLLKALLKTEETP